MLTEKFTPGHARVAQVETAQRDVLDSPLVGLGTNVAMTILGVVTAMAVPAKENQFVHVAAWVTAALGLGRSVSDLSKMQ